MSSLPVKIVNLGSGSRGNSTVICYGNKTLMVDCGFSHRQIVLRMTGQDINPNSVCGILVTHEHGDHIKGVLKCSRDFGVPVLATAGTIIGGGLRVLQARTVRCGETIEHEGFAVTPVEVSHDTKEPCAFLVEVGGVRTFFATDIGTLEGIDFQLLGDLDYLYVEANHDEEMLRVGPYPYFLKQRIVGDGGHLNNDQCGDLIKILAAGSPNLKGIMLAHLSDKNNDAAVAMAAVKERVGVLDSVGWVLARQDGPVMLGSFGGS